MLKAFSNLRFCFSTITHIRGSTFLLTKRVSAWILVMLNSAGCI